MASLRDISKRLKRLTPEAMEDKILALLRKNEKMIVGLNQAQLLEGQDDKGNFLTPPYRNDRYAEMKLRYNPLGVVDLRLTGDFYAGFFLKADKFPIYIFSDDSKTRSLAGKYGLEIFGLNEEHRKEVSEQLVLPLIKDLITKAVQI